MISYNGTILSGGKIQYICISIYILLLIITPSLIRAQNTTSTADSLIKFGQADYKPVSLETEKKNIAEVYTKVMNLKRTYDAENDFAAMFIEFNSGIRSLLESEIQNGKDDTLVALAKLTLKRHMDAQAILNTYLGKVKLAKNRKNKADEETGAPERSVKDSLKTVSDKIRNIKLTNNQDYDFASMMGLHCSGAVSLINNYLDNSDDATLEQVAQVLKDENLATISIIEKWKSSHNH